MANNDLRKGITKDDMNAYKALNKQLKDPFPENMVHGPEAHPNRPKGTKYNKSNISFEIIIGEYGFIWKPATELSFFKEVLIEKIWFSRHEILLYFKNNSILSCRVIFDVTNDKFMLFLKVWSSSASDSINYFSKQ